MMKRFGLLIIAVAAVWHPLPAQETDSLASREAPRAAVVVGSDTVFSIARALGPFSAQERADRAMANLTRTMSEEGFTADSLRTVDRVDVTDVVYSSEVLFTITNDDADGENTSRQTLATSRLRTLRDHHESSSTTIWDVELLISAGISLGALLALIGFFWILRRIFPRLYSAMERSEGTFIPAIRIRSHELVSAESMGDFLQIIARGLRLVISLIAVYIAVVVSTKQFSLTRDIGLEPYLFGFLTSILATAAAVVVFRGVMSFHTWSAQLIYGWKGNIIQPVRIKSVEVLSAQRIADLLVLTTKFGRFILFGFLLYVYISIILGLFPLTATWSETLFGYILTPFMNAVRAFVNYIPNLFSIIVIIGLTHYLLRLLRFISMEVARGTLKFPGFFADWALPTFKIARFLVIVFAAIVIFPYLPGSDSPFFQGISIFVGVLFSLGSTSAVSNIVSGVVLTYMRPFQVGDRVKIADTAGEIVEKTLLVTRIRTIKNVDVTVPNAMVLGAHIVNYSSSSENRGLILHTTITIGYDVPWRKVHELLLAAASKTENVLEEPKPFVYQTALNDFYVSYELNAYTDDPSIMARIYSDLHTNIQDVFQDAGVEIMSPHYSALRDGTDMTIPGSKDTPPKPPPPGFRIRNTE